MTAAGSANFQTGGFVMPYGDSPLNQEDLGERSIWTFCIRRDRMSIL